MIGNGAVGGGTPAEMVDRRVSPLPDGKLIGQAMRVLKRRSLALAMVVDESPSMRVWLPTVAALHGVLTACGVFRQVSRHRLTPWEKSLPDTVGRSVPQAILLVTDGLDEFWRHAPAISLLRSWSRSAPVAVLNPYPQQHWPHTNLPPRPLQLYAPAPVTPNVRLRVRDPIRWQSPFDEPLNRTDIPVPMLELNARWLRWWAELLARRGGRWVDGAAFVARPGRPMDRSEPFPDSPGPPQELVFRFRAESSPQAFQLATYLAAAPLELGCLRTIQAAMLPDSLPVHLAEIVTSPLVMSNEPTETTAPAPEYEFQPGVREALLACASRDDTARVVRLLAEHYGDEVPAAQSLFRALEAPDEVPDTPVTLRTLLFAGVELAVLRALSGPYAKRARRLARSIAAIVPQPAGPADPPEVSGTALRSPVPVGSVTSSTTSSPTAAKSGGNMSTSVPNDPPPSVLRALTDPAATSAESAISIDALLADQEPAPHTTVWGNVPPRNDDFTGRQELLTELEQRLRTESLTAVLPQALHGMGGVGKSQIATEYAYRHRTDYDVVWWIPAEQPAQILRALIELGRQLGLDVNLEANTAVRVVQEALRRGVPYANWLLIFDNAETLDTVRPYFPESGTGKVLVTSRNPQWFEIADALEIDVFSRTESIELLRKRNPNISVPEADRLAEALGDLPLAVGQATAWQATTNMPVGEYLRLLAEKQAELVGLGTRPGYEMPVAAAWNVALDRLGVENPAALQLLQVCSFFAPEPIARELFTGPRNAPISPELDGTLQNPSRLSQAIRDIQRYGLARIDHRDQTIHLHRLVRSVLVSRLSEAQRVEMEHGAHVLLAGGNPGNPDGAGQWPRYHALLPHVVDSNAVGCADPWARQLVLDVIEFYYYWGDHDGCRDLARQVVEAWREMLGPDDPQTLKAAKWLGFVQRVLGAFREAADINADCLERLRRTVGPDDEETLDAMILVAADLRAAGDFAAARDLDREAFDACLRAFGEDDPTTLRAAHSLGVSLRLTGEFQAALELDADTCRRRAKVLGPDHGLTLWTLNGFILDLRERGAYLQAHAEQEKLYERFQRVWGEDHPNTITAARNLAVSRRRAGQHERGRKLAEDTMNRVRRRFGALHPETVAAALNYAVDLRENDELVASRELAEQTYHEYESILSTDHPYTLYARTNLGIVLRLLGEVAAARVHDSEVFEALRQRLGLDHVLTLTCAINLASDLAALGEHAAARDLDADILTRSRERLGAEHPSTLACALNLSFDLTAVGQTDEGARLTEEVLAAYRRVLGARHPAITAALAGVRANCDVDPMPL